MVDIIPVIAIPHTGTQTVVKTIDPEEFEVLQNLCEAREGKITKEILDKEIQSKDLKYGYVLLEALAKENNIKNSIFLYKDIVNIVYGTITIDSIKIIKVLSEYNQIIMPMRDPLLSLISTLIRAHRKKANITASTIDLGGPLAPISVTLENISLMKHNKRRSVRARTLQEKSPVSPMTQNISGRMYEDTDYKKEYEKYKKYALKRLLETTTSTGGKKSIPGSEHIKSSNNLMRSQLFMWELWAKEIDKLNPFYVFMDLKGRNSKYQDIDFTHMDNINSAGDHPLRQAYNSRDLHYIATYLRNNLGVLINMESILRAPLEKLGYKDLLWWDQ